jgi:hypothetical protein
VWLVDRAVLTMHLPETWERVFAERDDRRIDSGMSGADARCKGGGDQLRRSGKAIPKAENLKAGNFKADN